MSKELLKFTLSEAKEALKTKQISPVELTEAYLKQAEDIRDLNSYLEICHESARESARKSEKKYANGTARALEGLPIAHKDIFCTKGIRTTSCSRILSNFVPPYESTVSQKLKDAGTVMLGKLNMDEFAMGSANLTSYYKPCYNPWGYKIGEKHLIPGGSSGGSAGAVAALAALAATGTDTGGSIRQPAAFCGLVGIKPTYGRCSRFGIMAFASSLDQPGPLTRTVKDAAMILQNIAGYDPKESTSIDKPVPNYLSTLNDSIKGKRVGIPKEYNLPGLDKEVNALWKKTQKWLEEEGAIVEEISLPHTAYALPVYYIVSPAEASSNLARYDGVRYGRRVEGKTLDELYELTREEGFGEEVQRRILMGTHILSAGSYDEYYIQALKVRRMIYQDFEKAFEKIDMILTPSTTSAAFTQEKAPTDPLQMYLNDIYTVTANLAGLPGISVPVGLTSQGLPLGMQLVAPAFEESSLLNMAQHIENKAGFPNLYEAGLWNLRAN